MGIKSSHLEFISFGKRTALPTIDFRSNCNTLMGLRQCDRLGTRIPIVGPFFLLICLQVEFSDRELDCSIQEISLAPNILDAEGDIVYDWSTGETDSLILVSNSGDYTLAVSDKCSKVEYTWNLEFEEISKEQPVYFPNVFSPNQDGVNECFVPVVSPETTILSYRLIIFDRWGNKYFETTEMSECWDGMYNGRNVRTGVFVYLLDIEYTYCVEIENLKKYGDVTVVHQN